MMTYDLNGAYNSYSIHHKTNKVYNPDAISEVE